MQSPKLTPSGSISIFELIWEVFFSPANGLAQAARSQHVIWAILLVVVISFVHTLIIWNQNTVGLYYRLWLLLNNPWQAALIFAFAALVLLFLESAALHGISWFLGGRGSYPELLSAIGFASLPPGLIGILLSLLTQHTGDLGEVLRVLGGIWTSLWGFILSILAIREAHSLSTLQAIGVHLVFLGIIIGFVVLWALAPLLALAGILVVVITLALWTSSFPR